MINFDDITRESLKEHNANWPQIPDHLHIKLIIDGSGSGKAVALLYLISYQLDFDKFCLYVNIHTKQNTNC